MWHYIVENWEVLTFVLLICSGIACFARGLFSQFLGNPWTYEGWFMASRHLLTGGIVGLLLFSYMPDFLSALVGGFVACISSHFTTRWHNKLKNLRETSELSHPH